MSTATKPEKAASKTAVPLHARAEELAIVNAWIHEHQDEILANGGVLTPELEALLEQAEGDFRTKMERLAMWRRSLQANAKAAKVEKDFFAEKQKMWENADTGARDYQHRSMERAGETSVKTALATVWIQDSPPSVQHQYDNDALCEIADVTAFAPLPHADHPLARFVSYEVVAKLDTRAVLDAWKARLAELEAEAAALMLAEEEEARVVADANDWIHAQEEAAGAAADAEWAVAVRLDAVRDALETKRRLHVEGGLATAFPGITVVQGTHVRQR